MPVCGGYSVSFVYVFSGRLFVMSVYALSGGKPARKGIFLSKFIWNRRYTSSARHHPKSMIYAPSQKNSLKLQVKFFTENCYSLGISAFKA